MNNKKSYLYAAISIFFWASTATLTKLLLAELNTIQIMCVSSFFAATVLFIINAYNKKLPLIKQYKSPDYIRLFLLGLLGIFSYCLFLYGALSYLPAQVAFIINYLWPVMIVIFAALLLKEKLTLNKIIAIALSFFGIIIVVTEGSFQVFRLSNPLGLLLAFLAAISYGLFSVIVKKHNYDASISMMFYYASAFTLSALLTFFHYGLPPLKTFQFLGLVFNGVFNSALAFTCWALALQHGETHKVANLVFVTPFLSLVYIYLFLNEEISLYSIVGLIIIVIGILLQNKERKA